MPVVARGRKIVEVGSGRVVGRAKSAAKAKASARIRNQKHREKQGR